MWFNLQNGLLSFHPKRSQSKGQGFRSAAEAFSYICRWDGESVEPLLEAIRFTRIEGGLGLQDYLRSAIKDLSCRVPMPKDIPHYVSTPILAADRNGKLLIGLEGEERVVEISTIRNDLTKIEARLS